jgi:GNAT superfamily N-acetyltransferase
LTVRDLGCLLPQIGGLVDTLYPSGGDLLLRRLEDALAGYATAHVVDDGTGYPIALAAEVEKGRDAAKLSTFWVSPFRRRQGVGTALLNTVMSRWQHIEMARTHVTVRLSRAAELEALLAPAGFQHLGIARNRYGLGQHVLVLGWTPTSAAAQVARPVIARVAA